MADQTAQWRAGAGAVSTPAPNPAPSPPPVPYFLKRRATSTSPAPTDADARLRMDLAQAQQERADLQRRLEKITLEFEKLKSRSRADNKRLSQMTAELSRLSVRVRDRDDESKGKAKLMDNIQDEMVTLNLQLNMAEREVKELKDENKQLVDRWMKWKGKEADRLNEESAF